MKKIIIYIIIILGPLFTYAQYDKLVRPTYLAMILMDQPSEEKMENVCQYYKLNKVNSDSDYIAYQHPDGTVLKFKIKSDGDRLYPQVVVETKETQAAVVKILTEAGYIKTQETYVKGSRFEHRRSICKISGGTYKTLSFSKVYSTNK